ncbi:multicopper oxidase family protein [Paenibacillus mesophilus]|uniref:multicopper oxidase family protein n=1 Tax=Paenibacillus mesophilus TaxID=2582849 RepID=UPI00110F2989|nr:multicopper oxidase family protein [Paenibacillus mesophilus]TMV51436.1 multicopper oxidase family protein [Paenibacillus mesophilus]
MKIGATFLLNRICIPILCIVVCLAASACGNRNLKFPEEIDMGHTGMSGHEGHAGSTISTGSERSCEKLVEAKSDGPTRTFELTAAKTSANVPGGKTTKAWTFNGSTPGPELRVREGDRVVVKLSNQDIGKGVTIHWHGVVLPCSQDGVAGVTQDAVMPGEQFTYEFVAKHPGTYWYHSHQQSSEQATMGLIGRLIVEPKSTTFRYDRDYAVTLQKLNDKQYLTNGRADGLALEAKPGETVRLRLINAYNEVQWMGVAGADFRVISMDGQDLNGPRALNGEWIPIGGGQRYDLLITMPENGQVQVYSKERKEWNIALGQGRAPEKLDKDAKEFDFTSYGTPKEDGITPQMKFDRSYNLELGLLDINGRQFHEIPPLVVKEGDWVKVRFEHKFGGPHPMHLHGHIFKVLTKNGKALSGSPIYADSILLLRGDVYEIAFRADNPGLWMEHCHNLGHAANGMTMMVNYEGVTTPFRVGTKSGNLPD